MRRGAFRVIGLLAAVLALGCGGDDDVDPQTPDAAPPPIDAFSPPMSGVIEPFPELYCPGSAGCETATGALRVGAARVNITPELIETEWTDENGNGHYEVGEPFVDVNDNGRFDAVWVAGFSNGRPATGIHDDIWVRALAFEVGDVRVGLAVIDAVGWFATEMDASRALIDPGLDIDHVMIASLHIHETPDTVGLWGRRELESGLDPDYQQLVRQATADAVEQAFTNLEPVTMSVARIQTLDESGSIRPYASDSRDPVVIDPNMTILRFASTAEPERTVATLVHWASHPEYAWSRNTLITADYVYWLREVVENGADDNPVRELPALEGLGGEVVFLNGPLGGLIYPGRTEPIGPDGQPVTEGGLPRAEAAGINLGRLALEAITSADDVVDVPSPSLGFRTGRLLVTVENTFYHVAGIVGVFDRQFGGYDESKPIGPGNLPMLESRITYLQIGNVGIISAPGELFPELFIGGYGGEHSHGFEFIDPGNPNPPQVANAPQPPYLSDLVLDNPGVDFAVLAGLTEDFLGYLPPAYDYVLHPQNPYIEEAEGDHYEETNSIGPTVEDEVIGAMREMINWRPN